MEERSKLRVGSLAHRSREQRAGKLGINFQIYCYLAVSVSLKQLLFFASLRVTANLACCERREVQNRIV